MASINEKLNYINGTKSLIKDKLNDLGSEITNQTTFRDYADKIEDLYEEWPKINDEDTTINLDNTKKGKMNLQLKGNISQFTTTGKNKFVKINGTQNNNGLETVVTKGNVFHIHGLTTAAANWFTLDITKMVLPAGTYTFSAHYDSGSYSSSATSNFLIFLRPHGGSSNIATLYPPNENNLIKEASFTIEQETAFDIFGYCIANLTFTNYVMKLQVESGSTATSYEPYTGGIVSPNPDYPQDIEIVTGENTITISNEDNTENQTFNIDLGDLELYKIKNLQDYIYELNNKWFIYNNSGKILLDGINKKFENKHSTITSETKGFYKALLPNKNETYSSGATDVAYSNYYKLVDGTASNAFNNNDFGMWWQNTGESVYFILDETSLVNANNWLKTHNTLVYYILATPVITEITDTTLINQLNNLKNAFSYNNQTNISQTNNNLPFVISASALLKNSN